MKIEDILVFYINCKGQNFKQFSAGTFRDGHSSIEPWLTAVLVSRRGSVPHSEAFLVTPCWPMSNYIVFSPDKTKYK